MSSCNGELRLHVTVGVNKALKKKMSCRGYMTKYKPQ